MIVKELGVISHVSRLFRRNNLSFFLMVLILLWVHEATRAPHCDNAFNLSAADDTAAKDHLNHEVVTAPHHDNAKDHLNLNATDDTAAKDHLIHGVVTVPHYDNAKDHLNLNAADDTGAAKDHLIHGVVTAPQYADMDVLYGQIPEKFRNVSFTYPKDRNFRLHLAWKTFYLRSKKKYQQKRLDTSKCVETIKVLAFLHSELKARNETMMLAYGGLLHSRREMALMSPEGNYMDNDYDHWATQSAIQTLLNMEPFLWKHFNWTVRMFYAAPDHAVFVQTFSVCGHKYQPFCCKAKGKYPGIEFYPLENIMDDGVKLIRDIWSGNKFPSSFLFPTQAVGFKTKGFSDPLVVTLPAKSDKLLTCIYGDWHQYSPNAGMSLQTCKD